jgi:hypothetical protein
LLKDGDRGQGNCKGERTKKKNAMLTTRNSQKEERDAREGELFTIN